MEYRVFVNGKSQTKLGSCGPHVAESLTIDDDDVGSILSIRSEVDRSIICGSVDDGDVVRNDVHLHRPRANRATKIGAVKVSEAVGFATLSLSFSAPRRGRDFFCESEAIPFPYSAAGIVSASTYKRLILAWYCVT
jgi:hypothetical protein